MRLPARGRFEMLKRAAGFDMTFVPYPENVI